MTTFSDYRPKKGVRQPRILYNIDDPQMAILEEFRRRGGLRHMNELYLKALKIGAEVMLSQAGADLSVFASAAPGDSRPRTYSEPDPAFSAPARPAPGQVATAPAGAPSAALGVVAAPVVPVHQERDDDKPSAMVPALQEPRVLRSSRSAAALAQFNRFGAD